MNALFTLKTIVATIVLVAISNFVFMIIHSQFNEFSFAWMIYLLNIPLLYLCYRIMKSLFKVGGVEFATQVNASPDFDFKSNNENNLETDKK